MRDEIELLDAVALAEDLPAWDLKKGEVGTVVEFLADDVYEVEFSDETGKTYAEFAVPRDQLIVLHNRGKGLRSAA